MEQTVYYILFFLAGSLFIWMILRVTNKTKPIGHSSFDEPNTDVDQFINDDKQEEVIAETVQHLRARYDTLLLVNDLSRKITASLNLDQAFTHLYSVVNSLMDASVMELDVRYVGLGENTFLTNLTGFDKDGYTNPYSDWSFTNNRPVFLNNAVENYARYVFAPLIMPDTRPVNSVMSFPIKYNDEVIGVFTIMSFNKNAFDDFHFEMVEQLTPFISASIKNSRYHRELTLLKQRAERSEDFMKQFLANMSHEIRTPIHAITGMTQLILDKAHPNEHTGYLNSIKNASETLLVIINDILDVSKIEANKLEIEQIDFSVTDVVRNVYDMLRLKAEEKNLDFSFTIDKSIGRYLKGDPIRLTQILLNLIGNAVKFTESGFVKISVDLYKGGGIVGTESQELFFSIQDTGIGISEVQQRRLFQKYTQASSEVTRKYGGTGLGLTIANQLVSLLGGTLGVNSKEKEGSTFFFSLKFPLSSGLKKAKVIQNGAGEMENKLSGIRVLITDDNEYNRIVARETLMHKIKDVFVDEAESGYRAIELLQRNKYDVILMDLVMPKMDGIETSLKIRNELPFPSCNTPIIVLTASFST